MTQKIGAREAQLRAMREASAKSAAARPRSQEAKKPLAGLPPSTSGEKTTKRKKRK